MANYRVFWPLESVAIGAYCSASGLPVHGVQSLSMTTSFNLQQVFELGQLDIYENLENVPSLEINMERVLDGYPLAYHLASRGATSKSLLNRTNLRADMIFSIFADTNDNASGTPTVQTYCSGIYISNLSYKLPVQGNCTESISFVGNDKVWKTSGFYFNGQFTGGDAPASGTQRRQMITMGAVSDGGSMWPSGIIGITPLGVGSGYNADSGTQYGTHIQDVTISCNLGREDLFELGRRRPYYRYANFPVSIETSITVVAAGDTPGDMVSADGGSVSNLTNEAIVIKLADGTVFDMGTRNKLQSVSFSGGDASGGVATITYNYQNFNKLDITSPADPEGKV